MARPDHLDLMDGQDVIGPHDARAPVLTYIGLGANLGDAAATLNAALAALGDLPLTQVTSVSSLYRTAPQDSAPGSPDYLNAVAALQTRLTAPALLAALQALEAQAGRERPYRNAPRTLDLDILLFGAAQVQSKRLTLPHPRLWQRAFVLQPLCEIAPELVSAQALAAVSDQPVQRLAAP